MPCRHVYRTPQSVDRFSNKKNGGKLSHRKNDQTGGWGWIRGGFGQTPNFLYKDTRSYLQKILKIHNLNAKPNCSLREESMGSFISSQGGLMRVYCRKRLHALHTLYKIPQVNVSYVEFRSFSLTFTHFFCRSRRLRTFSKILAKSFFSFHCLSQILTPIGFSTKLLIKILIKFSFA